MPRECPICRAENREGRRFCAGCGAPLALACPTCGFANEAGERLHRLQGVLLLKLPTPDTVGAEARLRRALEVARRQGGRSLELRAATSLSRLWLGQGKRADAQKLLADIYGWFTEGFDTRDLVEARALLAELNG